MVVIRTQVKELVKEAGIPNIGNDFMDALDEKAKQLILNAAARAKANMRRTIMARDL